MKSFHEKTADAARGKWRGILLSLGVPENALTGRHTACPMCGGEDRFRFDDQDRRGTYICGQCGAGDGVKFAMGVTGLPFRETCDKIDAIVGNVTPDAGRPQAGMDEDKRRAYLRDAWVNSKPVCEGDLAHRYLTTRGCGGRAYEGGLRLHPAMRDGAGGVRPAMLGIVVDAGGKPVSLHRTFLRPDGGGKAEMDAPRKLMPGELPEGACVRLSAWTGAGPIGIAEGIETAMSASILFGVPVWAAISTKIMAKWTPPEGADEVLIFGDNDPKFGGQAAAYALAHSIAVKPGAPPVQVHIPALTGTDWNDELTAGRKPA